MTDQQQGVGTGAMPAWDPFNSTPDPTVPVPSWGVPPSQTTAVSTAVSGILGSTQSVLQQLLSITGLDVPATNPSPYVAGAPSPYQDNFTQAFLTGVDPLQRQQAAVTGQSTFDLRDDRVYMGHTETVSPSTKSLSAQDSESASGPTGTKHNTTTVQAALNQPYLWSEDKRSDVMRKMREAGYNITSFAEAFGDGISSGGLWQELVARASRSFVLSNGENLVTPWDMLAADKKENVANGTLDKNGNIVHTSTSTSVNTLSEGQAWDTLRQTMQGMLGRDPSDQEVRDFLSAANADAAKDPSKTVSTTHTDTASGTSNTTSHTTGGYTSADAAQSAYQDIHNDADYGQYQSATTYFNAMLSALGEVAGSQ